VIAAEFLICWLLLLISWGNDMSVSHDYQTTAKSSYSLNGIRIAGVVACLPQQRFDNEFFVDYFSSEEILNVTKSSGVVYRHQVPQGITTADLCTQAASHLLDRLGWHPASLDGVVLMTQTPNQLLPATACRIHNRLGLSKHAFAFDVNLGCSAYPYGLWLAGSLMSSGARRILLLAGDTISCILNPHDRATALLFGDAGSATAIEQQGDDSWSFLLGTDGSGADALQVLPGGFLSMDGSRVFEFTLTEVPQLVQSIDLLHGKGHDHYLLHQANHLILQHIRRKCGINSEKFPINIDRFGNTSSATLPLLLTSNLRDELIVNRRQLALVGYGVGFSWAAASLPVGPIAVADLIELN